MSQLRPPSPAVARPGSLPGEAGFSSGPMTLANSRRCPGCGSRYPADFRVCPRDATPLEDAPLDGEDPMIGQLLSGTYEVLRMIGEGGMGRVYEARHSRLSNKRFAVKMLHQELARQPEVVARFQREAEAVSALSHPNIVSVFDVNTAPDGRPYIVAELLKGEQLGDYFERIGTVAPEDAIPIVRQVCRALVIAHARGIIHRDVKPENVFLLGDEGGVKVLDFGISKIAEDSSNLTKTGMVMGTPDYMAPEQARGDRVDARADVYAVGAILYRALTGKKPFEGLDQMATLTAALVQEPPRPSSINVEIPIGLELVVQRAMAKRPGERFQTMQQLEDALASFNAPSLPPSGGNETALTPTDVLGNTVMSRATRPQRKSARRTLVEHTAEGAHLSRPALAFFTGLGFLWVVANLTLAVAAVIRLIRGLDITPAESVLLPLAALAAGVTPLVVWVRFLLREVWQSTPRSLEMGSRVRRTVLYSAATYGIASLSIQLFETLLDRKSAGLAWAGWPLAAFQASLLAAIGTWFMTRMKRS